MIYLQIKTVRESLTYRRSEWGLGLITILWGVILLEPYETSVNPNWIVLRAWAPEWVWGLGAVAIGLARIIVLIVNGSWRKTAHARMVTAALCCFLWGSLVIGLMAAKTYSPHIAVYFGFLLMDLHTIYEAAGEARQRDEAYHGKRA